MNSWYKYRSKINKSHCHPVCGGTLGHQSSGWSILRGADDSVKKFPDDPDGPELCEGYMYVWSLIQVSGLKHTIDQSRGKLFILSFNRGENRGVYGSLNISSTSSHLSTQMWGNLFSLQLTLAPLAFMSLHFFGEKLSSSSPFGKNV